MHGCPRSGFLTSLLLAAALVACGGSGDATDSDDAPPDFSQSSCFWAGPYIQQSDETNFALLDTGAVYWTSSFTLPEGAACIFAANLRKAATSHSMPTTLTVTRPTP